MAAAVSVVVVVVVNSNVETCLQRLFLPYNNWDGQLSIEGSPSRV